MQHTDVNTEVTYHHDPHPSTKRIWRTFWILLFLTIIELALGFLIYAVSLPGWIVLFMKGIIVILTLAKAFYIVSIFMHLGDEIRNMVMTVIVPLLLFLWFIGAFLWDGNSYRTKRNKYDTYFRESTMQRDLNKADTARGALD